MSKICCLTGHREIKKTRPSEVIAKLENTLVDLIENEEFTDFRTGGAKGFDTIAATTIIKLKKKYPHIKLHLFLSHKNQSSGFSHVEKQVYDFILKNADSVQYTSQKYYDGVFLARDRQLVDGSDICVALLETLSGGTYYTVNYARKQKIPVHNITRK